VRDRDIDMAECPAAAPIALADVVRLEDRHRVSRLPARRSSGLPDGRWRPSCRRPCTSPAIVQGFPGLERPRPSATVGVMDAKLRDRLAIGLAAVSLVLALGTLMFGRYDPGVRLAASNGRVFITAVNERSIARGAGLAPGMVVTQLNNVTLIRFPQYVYPEPPLIEPSPNPETGE